MSETLSDEILELASTRSWQEALVRIIHHFNSDSGTIHFLDDDGVLHLAAARGIPDSVVQIVRTVPVGKGMAGLAVERRQPVAACNIQKDTSGDVRPGAKTTGLLGSIVVPIFDAATAVGALGIANHHKRVFTDTETKLLIDLGRALSKSSASQRVSR